ncbi:MAG: PaaX family transcriptional regulator C-terminal domain-containing protein [Rhizobiaceae bacterium]
MNAFSKELDSWIEALQEVNRLRVWSLVVTVFGDSVLPMGGSISASSLQELLQRLGVSHGAMRTALSRLAADDWVTSTRNGRSSSYTLSQSAKAQALQAEDRIYPAPASLEGLPLWLAVLPLDREGAWPEMTERLVRKGFASVTSGLLAIQSDDKPVPDADILFVHSEDTAIPDWLRQRLGPRDINASYRELRRRIASLARHASGSISAMDAIAARTLMVHEWRRIVLRHARFDAACLPSSWEGKACRDEFERLYRSLHAPCVKWLLGREEFAAGSVDRLASRFGGLGILEQAG